MTSWRYRSEAAAHAAKDPAGIWGERIFDDVGRRLTYWLAHRVRGGWSFCVWRRYRPYPTRTFVPKTSDRPR